MSQLPSTYTLISSNVLSTATASVTFSAIPSTYTDLVLRMSVRTLNGSALDRPSLRFNNSTANIFTWTRLSGDGTGAASARSAGAGDFLNNIYINGDGTTANTFGVAEVYIPNYAGTTKKPISSISAQENNDATAYMYATAHLADLTSAITTINIDTPPSGQNYMAGSSFYLYGIKNS